MEIFSEMAANIGEHSFLIRSWFMRWLLVISIEGGSSREIPLPDDGWGTPSPGEPSDLPIWSQSLVVDGLMPGTEYYVSLLQDSTPKAEAHFETLPARLPTADTNGSGGERPFTVVNVPKLHTL